MPGNILARYAIKRQLFCELILRHGAASRLVSDAGLTLESVRYSVMWKVVSLPAGGAGNFILKKSKSAVAFVQPTSCAQRPIIVPVKRSVLP